jgi:hypothetical protein
MNEWDYKNQNETSWYAEIASQIPEYFKKFWNSRSEIPIAALIGLCLGVMYLWDRLMDAYSYWQKIRLAVEKWVAEFLLVYFKK